MKARLKPFGIVATREAGSLNRHLQNLNRKPTQDQEVMQFDEGGNKGVPRH